MTKSIREDGGRHEEQQYQNKERREDELYQKILAYYDVLDTAFKVFNDFIKDIVEIDYLAYNLFYMYIQEKQTK